MEKEFNDVARDMIASQLKKHFSGGKPRSTYTESNAASLRPFIDRFIDDMKDVCIPYMDFYTISPLTLYKKTCDAFKWLCDNSPDKERYITARSRCKIQMSSSPDEGVLLVSREVSFKPRGASVPAPSGDWKESLMRWLETPSEQMFYMDGLNLSLDDKQMIENLLESANASLEGSAKMSWKVTFNSLRVMR